MITTQCSSCKNYMKELKCKAFADKIPEEILQGFFDHTEIYPNQGNEIIYEPIEEGE